MALTYNMRALAQSDNSYVFWESSTPDSTGTNAPEAIVPGTAAIVSVSGSSDSGSSSGRQLIYEEDFSALPTEDLTTGGDGVISINGVNWYLFRGNGGSADLTNGTGLELTQSSTVGQIATGGFLGMPFDQFGLDAVNAEVNLEFTSDVAITSWPNYVNFDVGIREIIMAQPVSDATLPQFAGVGFNQNGQFRLSYKNVSNSHTALSTLTTANDANLLTLPKVISVQHKDGIYQAGYADGVAEWPSGQDNIIRAVLGQATASAVNRKWGVQIIFYQTGTITVTFIIKKMRVFILE